MSMHLQRQTDRLKKAILRLSALVEEASQGAIRAVQLRDVPLAKQIIAADDQIDLMEIDVEEECLHTLALYQPVAFDLRFVVAVLKINNDLERIADLAVNVAEQAVFLAEESSREAPPFDLADMTRLVQWMIKSSLDALVNIDTGLAEEVRRTDDQVDALHAQAYAAIEKGMQASPERIAVLIHYLSISRQLERMADHAVNIAEDVLYMARGDILRHNRPHPIRDKANGIDTAE